MAHFPGEGSRMAPKVGGLRIVGFSVLLAIALAVTAAPSAGAADPVPCRVRNVTQDTSGRSLVHMIERSVDGDELRVRGTCPGPVVVRVDVVITGVGDRPTLTGRRRSQVVRVTGSAAAILSRLAIKRGGTGVNGGGILNRGHLSLVDSVVAANGADGDGGGIYNHGGSLTLDGTVVRGNVAGREGGGIYNRDGTITLTDSVIRGNEAGEGGGVRNLLGSVRLIDTIVTRNVAEFLGGGILSDESAVVTIDATSSVTGNSPDDCVGTAAC